MLNNPEELIKAAEIALAALDSYGDTSRLKPRFMGLPKPSSKNIWELRSHDVGKMIGIIGIINKSSDVYATCDTVSLECGACSAPTLVHMIDNEWKEPIVCKGCGARKPRWRVMNKDMLDNIKLGIIDDLMDNRDRTIAREKIAILSRDLTCKQIDQEIRPGRKVIVNGYLKYKQIVVQKQKTVEHDMEFYANSIEFVKVGWETVKLTSHEEKLIMELAKQEDVIDRLAQSVSDVKGHDSVKVACLLMLTGAPHKKGKDGNLDSRGTIHVLLIGNPGTGKTYIAKRFGGISPIYSFQSAATASGRGLVASVAQDKDIGGWVIYPGVVAMCHKGVVVIDEIDKTDADDYGDHNNAMNDMCFDDKTEILTKQGWKYFKEVQLSDKVATLQDGKYLRYQHPSRIINRQYKGNMYELKNQQLDICVTEGHNLYATIRKWGAEWKEFALRKVEGVYKKHLRFKKDSIWKYGNECKEFVLPGRIVNGKSIPKKIFQMDVWLRFMGWFISEGCVQKKNAVAYRVFISQRKNKYVKEIKNIINILGFKYSYDGKNFSISNKQLATYLNKYSKGATKKAVPSYIKDLPSRQIIIFLDTLIKGDGWKTKNSYSYCSSSKSLIDDVQELFFKIGKSGNVRQKKHKNRKIGDRVILAKNTKPHYVIHMNTKNGPYLNHHKKMVRKYQYKGRIYCVTVPDSVIYVRRNGIPVWCGNCVPIAKASARGRLETETSYLATANPENKVFTQYDSFYNQIDMPKDFLDRFDIIIPMTAAKTKEQRESVVNIMLERHLDAVPEKEKAWNPEFEKDFIQKYIAYCRKFNPKIEKKLFAYIQKKLEGLMQIRGGGHDTEEKRESEMHHQTSLRHLEGIIRFAYASARLHLRDVTKSDIDRAFELKRKSFLKLGIIDEGTGKFDWFKAENISEEVISDHQQMQEIIKDLGKKMDLIPIDDIMLTAKEKGVEEEKMEEHIAKLKKKGDYFEPKPGFLKKI